MGQFFTMLFGVQNHPTTAQEGARTALIFVYGVLLLRLSGPRFRKLVRDEAGQRLSVRSRTVFVAAQNRGNETLMERMRSAFATSRDFIP